MKIMKYSETERDKILSRSYISADVEDSVREIVENVAKNGDAALRELTARFDKVEIKDFPVSPGEIEEALAEVGEDFLGIMERAASNIRKFHEKQLRSGFIINDEDGILMGQKVIPVDSAGLYVPGGTAAYPSTVLMDSVPAKIAGVKNVIMCTPPGPDGKINPYILAAAHVAGIDRIYKVGGAQAIAAMAYGTESIPKVDKIVGPGNAYVAEAKKQVFGMVSIDMIAGPSEILIIADGASDPVFVASDLLSQAEHDRLASAVLITDSMELAEKVSSEVDRQLETLPRREIASASIENNGKIIVCDDIPQAVEVANDIAPEHLELSVDDPFDHLDKIRHAGSVFIGRYAPEPLGDYFSGANHTLPTGGTARFSSPLSVDDFVKKLQYTYYTRDALARVGEDIACFARKEGLEAHARSIEKRMGEDDK
ncbi:MAG: histidinol dehydrogenase [Eubacteriaceae bacterium]|nr:histidinol dehydrogenase [Eubacteriaceae bacterium]